MYLRTNSFGKSQAKRVKGRDDGKKQQQKSYIEYKKRKYKRADFYNVVIRNNKNQRQKILVYIFKAESILTISRTKYTFL